MHYGSGHLPIHFRFWHFQKCSVQKKFLIDFLDELGNLKQKKKFYTFFENDTFESV